jgi:hypothetical protein
MAWATAMPAAPIAHPEALTGAWFDPSLQGEGYFVLVTDSGTVVTYYGYDHDGARLWLVSGLYQGPWTAGVAASFTVFRGTGGVFALPQATVDTWGTLSLRFDNCDQGEAILDGPDGHKVSALTRLAGVRDQLRCDADAAAPDYTAFSNPQRVEIVGYTDDAMEPFISRDGRYLLFNNSNAPGTDTNLHYAERVNDLVFNYRGLIDGVNTPALDGVPSLDDQGRLYFVSTQFYAQTLATLFRGQFSAGQVSSVELLAGLSEEIPGHLNFDAEISADGLTLVFVDGIFSGSAFPDAADLALAARDGAGFRRLDNSAELFAAINTENLEYAPCLSRNGLELFFSRYSGGQFRIYRSTRWRSDAAFEAPQRVIAIDGFAEAPALSPDERSLYFHRQTGSRFEIFRVSR